MHRLLKIILLVLVGCSSSSEDANTTSFPPAPLMNVTSASGKYVVEVRTSPTQPPSRGEHDVQLVVRDATTQEPQSGLTVDVLPWMPAMGHGTSVVPTVTEAEPGIYVVSDVDLFMPGTWELRTNLASDHVGLTFQIP